MNANLLPQSVGIDVSKATIDVAIRFDSTQVLVHQFPNTNETAIKDCCLWLVTSGVTSYTPIVVESTGSYHWLVCLLLSEQGLSVRLINPLLTKKYQRWSVRGAKTDKIDARRLAEIGVIETDLPLFYDSRESLQHKKYHTLYAKLIKVQQQLTQCYQDALDGANSIGISLQLESIQDCLDQIDKTITVLRKLIETNISPLAVQIDQVKGISPFQASVITSAVEGRQFGTRDQLIAFFGLDVQVKQSGQWQGKAKLSKRGNSFYRLILFQIGWSLSRNNPEFTQYYKRLRSQGKHYYTCILATARKFLRYLFVYYLKPNYDLAIDISL